MARPYSLDLRERVVASVEGGRSCRETALAAAPCRLVDDKVLRPAHDFRGELRCRGPGRPNVLLSIQGWGASVAQEVALEAIFRTRPRRARRPLALRPRSELFSARDSRQPPSGCPMGLSVRVVPWDAATHWLVIDHLPRLGRSFPTSGAERLTSRASCDPRCRGPTTLASGATAGHLIADPNLRRAPDAVLKPGLEGLGILADKAARLFKMHLEMSPGCSAPRRRAAQRHDGVENVLPPRGPALIAAFAGMVDEEHRAAGTALAQESKLHRRPGISVVLLQPAAKRGRVVGNDQIGAFYRLINSTARRDWTNRGSPDGIRLSEMIRR